MGKFKSYELQKQELLEKIGRIRGKICELEAFGIDCSETMEKLDNLLWWDAKGAFYNLYHSEYAELLGWSKADRSEFESDEVRDFVANVLMYNHSQYKKREDSGQKVRIENVEPSLRKQKWWRGITGFFARLFGKKDK